MTVKHRARPGAASSRRALARAALAGLAALTAAGGARRAQAHPEFSALGSNRYVTAAIFDGRVEVSDALLEGTLVSADERRRLDADGDGSISDAERVAGEARLRAEGPAVAVEVDGRPVTAPLVVAIGLGEEPLANAAPLVIERRLSFPGAWPAGAHRLRLVIAREPPRLIDTELGVVLGPGLSLAGEDRVSFRGPRASALEERAATFDVTGPPPPPAAKPGRVAALLGLLGLVAAGALAARALRRRSARS